MDAPRDDLQNLPESTEALRALVLTMMSERDAAVTERDILLAQNDRLRHLLLQLRRMQFGARSERLPEDQLQLGLEALEQAIAKDDAEAEKRDGELRRDNAARRRASRGALPAHLPRIEVTLSPEDTACPCCRAPMTVIGEDMSERLDVIPAQFRVIVTRRPKFACRACTGTVVQAPAPARLIEGGIPTEALVAHVLVARYADHLPLYRQAQILARQGVILERSTLAFWMGYAAVEIAPVVARLREMMLASTRIFADETVVPVLDPGRGRTKQGYFWAMARDDRPWGGSEPPAVAYSYAPGRGHVHATTLLGGYRGILQCDGYAAHKQLVGPKSNEQSMTLVFCWSHVRRGFYDLAKTKAPIAMEALRRIAALYEIEDRVRGKSPLTGWPCGRPRANRWSPNCASGSKRRSRNCPPAARLPRRSAMRSIIGRGWIGFSTMDVSNSTPTVSSAPCGRSHCREKIACSPAATRERKTGHAWRR
jgi:transposase